MSDLEIFTIDDDFDPLASTGIEVDEEPDEFAEFSAPIPDAELSRVPEPVILPPEERIENLLKGLPGQRFRVLHLVSLAQAEPVTMEQMALQLDEDYPQRASVFSAAQLVELLERAGGLEVVEQAGAPEANGDADAASAACAVNLDALTDEELELYLEGEDNVREVEEAPALLYRATDAGTTLYNKYVNLEVIEGLITAEPRYMDVYRAIFQLLEPEGGASMKELDAAINGLEALQSPKRFCGYFLDRLEKAGAVEYRDTWKATARGRQVAASGILDSPEATAE